jgi:hypothetical protein
MRNVLMITSARPALAGTNFVFGQSQPLLPAVRAMLVQRLKEPTMTMHQRLQALTMARAIHIHM